MGLEVRGRCNTALSNIKRDTILVLLCYKNGVPQ
jgi:hypothetical protein